MRETVRPSSSLAPGLHIRDGSRPGLHIRDCSRPKAPTGNPGAKMQVMQWLLPQQSSPCPQRDARKSKACHTQQDHWPPRAWGREMFCAVHAPRSPTEPAQWKRQVVRATNRTFFWRGQTFLGVWHSAKSPRCQSLASWRGQSECKGNSGFTDDNHPALASFFSTSFFTFPKLLMYTQQEVLARTPCSASRWPHSHLVTHQQLGWWVQWALLVLNGLDGGVSHFCHGQGEGGYHHF